MALNRVLNFLTYSFHLPCQLRDCWQNEWDARVGKEAGEGKTHSAGWEHVCTV